jgi:hypothetical protein
MVSITLVVSPDSPQVSSDGVGVKADHIAWHHTVGLFAVMVWLVVARTASTPDLPLADERPRCGVPSA